MNAPAFIQRQLDLGAETARPTGSNKRHAPPVRQQTERQRLLAEMNALYRSILDEAKRRRAFEAKMEATAQKMGLGYIESSATLKETNMRSSRLATAMIEAMLRRGCRARLGIDPAIEIDTRAIREAFDDELRVGAWDDKSELEPRIDFLSIDAYMDEHYGAEAGKALLRKQVANWIYTELQLRRQEFVEERGKVCLSPSVSGHGQSLFLQRLADAFGVVCGDSGLAAMDHTATAKNYSGSARLSPDLSVRCFNNHVRLTMSAALANSVRAFIGDHLTTGRS